MSDFLFMPIVMPALTVTIFKITTVKIVHDHDLDLSNGSRSKADILIESPSMTLYVMTIVMLAI